jgi:hypothetical protein
MTKTDVPLSNPDNPKEKDSGEEFPPSRTARSAPLKFESWLEIVSAIMLAVVAIATAWNSYQAARWSSLAGIRYGQASARRVESTRASTTAGQQSIIDVSLFTNWINAYAASDEKLLQFYQRRFRAEFKPAFEAWMATDPANNPDAPPSPFAMPEYVLENSQKATQLEQEATQFFSEGKQAIENSTRYVLNTVFLATVLFFVGISIRFKLPRLRLIILIFAMGMLIYGLINLAVFPIY